MRLLLLIVLSSIALLQPRFATAQLPEPDPEILLHLKTRAEVFTQALARGQVLDARGEMDRTLRQTLTDEGLSLLFSDLQRRNGRLLTVDSGTIRLERDGRVVAMVPLVYEQKTVGAQVVFERQGPLAKVVGFSILPWTPPATSSQQGAATGATRGMPPPSYANPAAFREIEVIVQANGGPELPAILALPAVASADAPVPAALILPGEGAFDADGTLGANKPMRDIAQGLAASGVATLRFPRRANVAPQDFKAPAVYDARTALVDDALAALEVLRAQDAIQSDQVSIVGHGLGGWLAPTLAVEDGNVARMVLLAPHGADLEASLVRQARRLAGALPEEAVGPRQSLLDAAERLPQAASSALDPDERVLEHPAKYWQTLLARKPAAALSVFKGPAMALFSTADAIVDEEDRASWEEAVTDTNLRSKFGELDGLNHFFIPAGDGGMEGLTTRGNVSETVVRETAAFLRAGGM